MTHELTLPDVGEGVAEGEIIRWLVTEGQAVKEDQPLVEVLTDKADVEIPSPVAGIVSKIVAGPGRVVKVGEVMALIDVAPEGLSILADATSLRVSPASSAKDAREPAPPSAPPAAPKAAAPKAAARPTGAAGGESLATPAVRRLAKEFGVDVSNVRGSGPDGRVTEADVERAAGFLRPAASPAKPSEPPAAKPAPPSPAKPAETPAPPPPPSVAKPVEAVAPPPSPTVPAMPPPAPLAEAAAPPAPPPAVKPVETVAPSPSPGAPAPPAPVPPAAEPASPEPSVSAPTPPGATEPEAPTAPAASRADEERVPFRGKRRMAAKKMVEAKTTVPHALVVDEADVTELLAMRGRMREAAEREGVRITILPLIVRAVVAALRKNPAINASLDEAAGEIVLKKHYDIGIAVDAEDGLVVPVVRNAGEKGIVELAREIERLAESVRAGTVSRSDVGGSTFTVTSIGSIGGLFSYPVINIPDAAVLGVHRVAKRVVVRDDGAMAVRDMVYLSLSFDHRIVDGGAATRFLNDVILRLESPAGID